MKIVDINGKQRECVKAFVDKKWPGFMRVEYQTAVRQHHEWYEIDKFIKNNPDLAHLAKDAPEVTQETLGVVTSSNKKSLKDSKQNWSENAYAGMPVWISRGLGEGQVRNILSNTKNTLALDKAWEILPNKTSQYVISYNIPDHAQAWGNTLPGIDKPPAADAK